MSDFFETERKPSAKNSEWYQYNGESDDVVVSSRIRLARNLADFPFPQKYKTDDAVRIQTLVFDSFAKNSDSASFKSIAAASLTPLHAQVLLERSLIKKSTLKSPGAGIVMCINGSAANSGLVCTINDTDHIRIACFTAGLNCEDAYKSCSNIDNMLQKNLQFAGSYEYGYLTSNIKDCGSGIKLSARVHLPSTAFLNGMGKLLEEVTSKRFSISPAFASSADIGGSVGAFYQISADYAGNGSEIEQLALFESTIKTVVEIERHNRDYILQHCITEAMDLILKSFAMSKYALMINLREAIRIISDIKWGKNMDLIKDIDSSELTSILYRCQEAHIKTIIKEGTFNFPPDIAGDEKKSVARLRSLLLQDTFENIKLSNGSL